MNVNGITSVQAAYTSYPDKKTQKVANENSATTDASLSNGVVYEASKETKVTGKYKPDLAMIQKLKADAQARTAQLRSIVEELMTKQSTAYGQANDIWSFLASGDYKVDPATKAQAQADISENGYWGVEQTSSRIIDFATALTGGAPDKIEEMREAFQKGYAMAEKKWGGKLPEISQKTYDAVMKKFDELAGITSQ